MGYGSYSSTDWSRLKTSASISATSTANDIFKQRSLDPKFDPRYINKRESIDSEDHPLSTPVIIGLDVTGSMGYLSAEIAKNGLNETMMQIYSTKPIPDPHMMFAAIGDVRDNAPLQVTQFEADIRIAEQLLNLWLEGRGGDGPEDYQLLWYFAAKHTKIDCFEKRGKKGILFTIGDAGIHSTLTANDIANIFSDKDARSYTSEELFKMASEKYEVFHIHITKTNDCFPAGFYEIMNGHMLRVPKEHVNLLPEIIISTLELIGGKSKADVLAHWPEMDRPVVSYAIEYLNIANQNGGLSF